MTLPSSSDRSSQGIALITVLLLVAVLAVITVLSFSLTMRETRTSKLSAQTLRGYYAAEAGLSKRASDVRQKFRGYELPQGVGPTTVNPCSATNQGSGDLACQTLSAFTGRSVLTYARNLTRDQVNGDPGVVEAGNPFAGMNYLQFAYKVYSQAKSTAGVTVGQTEARAQVEFQARLIPIFQFMGFFQNDLEYAPGTATILHGRLHSNKDAYLGGDWPGTPNPSSNMSSSYPTTVTAAGTFYSVRPGNPARGYQNFAAINGKLWPAPQLSKIPLTDADKAALLPDAVSGVAPLVAPPLTGLKQSPTSDFWRYADLRIVALKTGASYTFLSRNYDGTTNTNNSSNLTSCAPLGGGANVSTVSTSSTLYDGRESQYITTLNVNQASLMKCLANGAFTRDDGTPLLISDATNGGLVIHMSIDDPAATNTGFGVRVTDAAQLGVPGAITTYVNLAPENGTFTLLTATTVRFGAGSGNISQALAAGTYGCNVTTFGSDPAYGYAKTCDQAVTTGSGSGVSPKGLTFVSDQPIYLQGNFNSTNKIPAAVMADAINLLSNNWDETKSPAEASLPVASQTIVNAALLSGSDITVPNVSDSGGMHNFMRLHENWNGVNLTFRGSIVSLGTTLHTRGAWCIYGLCYEAPTRNYDYDTTFDTAAGLPPLTPNVVYLRQLVYGRQY